MAYEAVWAKDPAINKFEFVKLQTDGLDVIRKIIEKYAHEGYASIPEDDLVLFKWAGVYEQKPKGDGYFMMRVRINSGIMTTAQVRRWRKSLANMGVTLSTLQRAKRSSSTG